MHEIQLTEDRIDRLRNVARRADALPLEDRQSLRALREDFQSDSVLRSLGAAVRKAIGAADAVLLRNTPIDSDFSIMALFQTVAVPSSVGNGGGIVYTVVAKTTGEQTDISDTDSEFPPHTDSTFLREPHHFVALACVEREPRSGGESRILYIDALRSEIEEGCGPHVLECLAEPAYPFPLEDPLYGDGVQVVPIFRGADGTHTIRYRYDLVEPLLAEYPQKCPERNQEALSTLKTVLDGASPHERFTLETGDILIFDNRRVLHARTPIKPGAVRVLRRLKGYAMAGPGFEVLPQ